MNMKYLPTSSRSFRLSNLFLLILVVFIVFLIPLFPLSWHDLLFPASYTLLFLTTVLALQKHRERVITLALIAIATEWIVKLFHLDLISYISSAANLVFFSYAVASFIAQIVASPEIKLKEIIESINGYLLLGILFSILIALVNRSSPGAYNFPEVPQSFSHYLYYGFVTLSTLGYGDIVPKIPVAKSLAILTSVGGQLYIATIIAILVGKYAGGEGSTKRTEVN